MRPAETMETDLQPLMRIGGDWRRSADHHSIPVLNKYDGTHLASIPEATVQDVHDAVSAAETAFENEYLTPHQRFEILKQTARIMDADSESLARLLVQEVGKTIREAHGEVKTAAAALVNAAEEAKRIDGETVPLDANPGHEQRFAYVSHTPSGPVCAITAFNLPLNQSTHKLASALAAGSSVVLKPSDESPLAAFRLIQILEEAGLPEGWSNLVFGRGQVVGRALLEDSRFARYTFTGSAPIGQHILETVGIRPVILELGSNAPTIVFSDADLEKAARAVCSSGFRLSGQLCTSTQRLFVHRSVMDDLLEIMVPLVANMKVGNPMDEETDVGPMLTDAASERAEKWLQDALDGGARLITGGERDGRMFTPTLVTNLNPEMALVCQEVFAPIVGVLPFDDTKEAIRRANDTPFGLQAGVFTRDFQTAFECARRLRYGTVLINDASSYRAPNSPFGGVKNSGMGREGPKYAIRELTDFKTVMFNLA